MAREKPNQKPHLRSNGAPDWYAGIFAASPAAIRLADLDGTILAANDAFVDLSGYSREELLGKKVVDMTAPEDVEREAAQTAKVIATGEPAEYEKEYMRRDGRRMAALLSIFLVRDEGGRPLGVAAVAKDITREVARRQRSEDAVRRQAEELREQSTPILRLRERILILPIIGPIDQERSRQLTNQLLDRIIADKARVAVLDITGMPQVDSAVAQHLLHTVRAARLLGAKAIVTGISAENAETLTRIEADLEEIETSGSLWGGIEAGAKAAGITISIDKEAA